MGFQYKPIGLVFILFWLLIPASVVGDSEPCQDGLCLKGEFYNDKNDSCLNCPDQTFMDYSDHKCKDCFSCSIPDSNEVILQACAPISDAVIGCVDGYYRGKVTGLQSKGQCVPCTVCKDGERTIKKCDSSSDARCCSLSRRVRSKKDGRILCDLSSLLKSVEPFAWVINSHKDQKGLLTLQPETPNKLQDTDSKTLFFTNFHEEDFRDNYKELMIVPISILSIMIACGVFLCCYTSFEHRHTLNCFRRRSESHPDTKLDDIQPQKPLIETKDKRKTNKEKQIKFSEQQSLFSNTQTGSLNIELTVTPPTKDKFSAHVLNGHVSNGHLPNMHVSSE